MRFSHQVQYAICGVFDLAYNGDGSPVQVRVIGARQGIPMRYLEQIFQRLRKARLVSGKRGPGGGYVLVRPAAEISIRDIVEAVEGPLAEIAESSGTAPGATHHRPDFVWRQLADGFSGLLGEISIESLCREAARSGVIRSNAETLTYQI